MNRIVRSKLIEIARRRGGGIIQYQELSVQCNLGFDFQNNPHDRLEIGKILGEISAYEERHHRPLLSSLVLSANGYEGDGFYKLCEELGYGEWRTLRANDAFAIQQMNRCYDFWNNEDNYAAFRDA